MQAALRLKTRVLPGKRIEFTAPEPPESGEVELIVVLPETSSGTPGNYVPMLEIARATPPGPRPFATWEEYERFLQEEKDSWDR